MIPKQRQYAPVPSIPAETLAAAVAGDREAFGEIYRTHHDEVFRFVCYRVSTRVLAEDITAETFVRAIRSIGGFAATGSGIAGWLVTIARNLIADHFKSSRTRMEISTGEMFDRGLEPGPEDIVLARIATQTVRDAIGALNPKQRACIEARYLDQLTVAETADRVGSNEYAIKTLAYRAIRTLGRDPRLAPEAAA